MCFGTVYNYRLFFITNLLSISMLLIEVIRLIVVHKAYLDLFVNIIVLINLMLYMDKLMHEECSVSSQ